MARNSSIELLRILSILMIIVLHSIGFNHCCSTITSSFLGTIGNCGVTIFILISGYYGITRRPEKLFKLRNIASLYILCALLFEFIMGGNVTPSNIFSGFFPVISGKYWFLSSYIILMVFATYINKLIDSLKTSQLGILAITLILIFYVVPTFLKYSMTSDGGKGITYMIIIYIIGRYYSRVNFWQSIRRIYYAIAFTLLIVCIIFLNRLQTMTGLVEYFNARHFIYSFDADSSLFILLASSCVLFIFLKTNFCNRIINKISLSVFAVYIMEWYARPFLLSYIDITNMNIHIQPFAIIAFAIVVFVACAGIDQLRMLLTSNIEERFEAFECSLYQKLTSFCKRIVPKETE